MKRAAILFTAGVAATLALPPVYWWPLLIPALGIFYRSVVMAPNWKRAAWCGYWFGLGHFMSGLYWMCIALLVEPEQFAWLIPFTLFGLMSIIALYMVLTAVLAYFVLNIFSPHKSYENVFRPAAILLFSLVWLLAEVLRGALFTGFPWNLIGYSWATSLHLLQFASVVGVYGLSFLTVFGALSVWLYTSRQRGVGTYATLIILGFVAIYWWGGERLEEVTAAPSTPHYVRIVQGNIPQHLKWSAKERVNILRTHMSLSQTPSMVPLSTIIWPEAAVPDILSAESGLNRVLAQILPQGTTLITGALRTEGANQSFRVWNSVFMLNAQAEVVAHYDKRRLVPFGEYVPFSKYLPLEKITPGVSNFSEGANSPLLTSGDGAAFSTLICYESIFTSLVETSEARPSLLVLTNDAWFGTSSGPYQHLQMGRMRAVEYGVPMLRAANTGISAVVDAYGRVLQTLPLGAQGVIDTAIPAPSTQKTAYSQHPWAGLLLLIAFLSLFTIGLTFLLQKGNNT